MMIIVADRMFRKGCFISFTAFPWLMFLVPVSLVFLEGSTGLAI